MENEPQMPEMTPETPEESASPKNNQMIIIGVLVLVLILVGGYVFMKKGGTDMSVDEEETTEVVETPTDTSIPAPTPSDDIPAMDSLTVSYTSEGFSPYILEVNAGDTVRFVNNSNSMMWVEPNVAGDATEFYPEFGMSKSVAPGETYEFMFTLTGTWGYRNLNKEDHFGGIVVLPQKAQ